MHGLLELWRGRQPLKRALWEYALLWGTLLNVAALLAAFAVAAAGGPGLLAFALFLLPLPYVLVAVVGVWRSAGAAGVEPARASAARLAVTLWAVAMLVV